jgi:hypothetical protein
MRQQTLARRPAQLRLGPQLFGQLVTSCGRGQRTAKHWRVLEKVVTRHKKDTVDRPDAHAVRTPRQLGNPAMANIHGLSIKTRQGARDVRAGPLSELG